MAGLVTSGGRPDRQGRRAPRRRRPARDRASPSLRQPRRPQARGGPRPVRSRRPPAWSGSTSARRPAASSIACSSEAPQGSTPSTWTRSSSTGGSAKDPRVVTIEKNARTLAPADIPEAPDIVTMDVSFISVLKILPALKAIPGDWTLVSLVKPQFEAGPKDVGKKGVVRDAGGPRRGPGAGRRRGPRARLRPRGPHPLLDARPERATSNSSPGGSRGRRTSTRTSSQPGSRRRSAMNNVRKAGIVIKPHAPSVEGILKIVVEYFEGRGIACVLEDVAAAEARASGRPGAGRDRRGLRPRRRPRRRRHAPQRRPSRRPGRRPGHGRQPGPAGLPDRDPGQRGRADPRQVPGRGRRPSSARAGSSRPGRRTTSPTA